jgi:hypothetical protein
LAPAALLMVREGDPVGGRSVTIGPAAATRIGSRTALAGRKAAGRQVGRDD